MEAEFLDWEVLHSTETADVVKSSGLSVANSTTSDGIEGDTDPEGMIRSDYFSLDNHNKYAKAVAQLDASEEGSVDSDNPSWIDPGSENRFGGKNSGEFWPDSGSERSDERSFSDVDAHTESGVTEIAATQVGFGEARANRENMEIVGSGEGKYDGFHRKGEFVLEESAKSLLKCDEFNEIRSGKNDLGKFWSDSGGDDLVLGKLRDGAQESVEVLVDGKDSDSGVQGEDGHPVETQNASVAELKSVAKSGGEEEKRKIAWWKVPNEVLKYCVFRATPLWSFSVAAAVMGLVILGRRLYKMKRKTHSLQLKVSVDDKKVSQFMGRAARLNEAFSVVRRVPVVRPSLPAAGVNPWPVMSLR